MSLATARKEAIRLQREAQEAPSPVSPVSPSIATSLTYGALVASYTELHLQPNTRVADQWNAILTQEAMQPLIERTAASISKSEVVALLDGLVAARKPHAAANLLKVLHAMFAWASARDDVAANPCYGVRPPVRGTPRERVLKDAEIVAVLAACDEVPAPFGAMVRMLLHTGARRDEVAKMKWSELDDNVWTLPAARSKSRRANVLPLPPAAMAILRSLPRFGDDAFIFTTTGGTLPSSDYSKRKRLLDQASGISDWRLHDLRRTCRTRMSQLGVSRETARRVLGHSVDSLDARYDQHDHRGAKAAALAMIADHLAALMASRS